MLTTVTVNKLVHGGQALGELPDGRKIFVWNALPGEVVGVRIIKSKNSYAEGIAEEIIQASSERVDPQEPNYLATSPWQILAFKAENLYKQAIVREVFTQAGITLPKFKVTSDKTEYGYRNKMEYSFWGDDDGLHLALHARGSHQKQIVTGCALAMAGVDEAAKSLLGALPPDTRAGDLKTIVVRCNQNSPAVAALFVKRMDFYKIKLPKGLKGLRVYYSNPKSPASVPTKLLYELGDCTLSDTVQGLDLQYDVDSFFQVNVPVFEQAVKRMRKYVTEDQLIDMYCGVGGIGLCLAKKAVDLIELDPATAAMARHNAAASHLNAQVIETPAEKALDYINSEKPVIFDPPRAGLHDKIISQILKVLPPKIVYLSCNPSTQARDLAKLQSSYKIKHFEVFNFFPRTPHIESLAILTQT